MAVEMKDGKKILVTPIATEDLTNITQAKMQVKEHLPYGGILFHILTSVKFTPIWQAVAVRSLATPPF